MQSRWRRWWLLGALGVALLIAVTVHFVVDYATREQPNYSRIENGLWLGGHVAEPPPDTQAVLNLCEIADIYVVPVNRWEPIRDAAPAPSLDWLKVQVGFIEAERAANRTVYVHCMNGASRSSMVMAAYLMRRNRWPRDQTIEYLRARRPEVRPNSAFLARLLEWEAEVMGPK